MPTSPGQNVTVAGRTVRVSSLDKVLYPLTGTTKAQVLQYYVHVWPLLSEELQQRPVTRVRWPHGVDGQSFFEKNLPSGAPSWIPSVRITGHGSRREGAGSTVVYPLISDLSVLVHLVNLGSLELHVPQWRVAAGTDDGTDAQPLPPDRLVIDLDPGPGAGLTECARVALMVRERLTAVGLHPRAVTSGSKGMQLYADLETDGRTSAQVSEVVQALARALAEEHPDQVVWRMTKAVRRGKVFLDWSQNNAAKTTICPYSLRGTQEPQVAAPRTWDEVQDGADDGELQQLLIEDVIARTS